MDAGSEAVAAMLVNRSARAHTRLLSCGVQAGGRGASLTAPNGSAQRMLIQTVAARAGLPPTAVGGVQPQGLGSAESDRIRSDRLGSAGLGSARRGLARFGAARRGLAWLGSVELFGAAKSFIQFGQGIRTGPCAHH